MAKTLTSTNSVFTISVDGVYSGVRVEGFSTDDAFAIGAKTVGVGMVGVDGKFSYAYTPSTAEMTISLQADSDSIEIFDNIYALQENGREAYLLSANIQCPSLKKSYSLSNGVLTSYTPMPDHKQTLSPQQFTIVWGKVSISKI